MPALPTETSPAELPADWKERLLRALASEGVTEPPDVPVWRSNLINYGKAFGSILLVYLYIGIGFVADPFIPGKVFKAAFAILWFATLIFLIWYLWPRMRAAGLKSWSAGRNPTHAVLAARRPPIFYLRSFGFDEVASRLPWGGGVTAEVILIARMRRYAPVLAIGKPGEVNPPPGAIRFHVTDACWEATVKSIVPCCQLVVWVTGNTPGLNWEIEHLVTSLPPHRLLLWPHVNVENTEKVKFDWHATAQQRNTEWQQFVEVHRDVFPRPLPRDVENIRFIAFDAGWTPVPIPSARYPVMPMDRQALDRIDPKQITLGLRSFLQEKFQAGAQDEQKQFIRLVAIIAAIGIAISVAITAAIIIIGILVSSH